jgi:hypothetical protein
MRLLALLLSVFLASAADGQEKAVKKKPVAKRPAAAHKKPTPEQIRKFNQMQKQREAKG